MISHHFKVLDLAENGGQRVCQKVDHILRHGRAAERSRHAQLNVFFLFFFSHAGAKGQGDVTMLMRAYSSPPSTWKEPNTATFLPRSTSLSASLSVATTAGAAGLAAGCAMACRRLGRTEGPAMREEEVERGCRRV